MLPTLNRKEPCGLRGKGGIHPVQSRSFSSGIYGLHVIQQPQIDRSGEFKVHPAIATHGAIELISQRI